MSAPTTPPPDAMERARAIVDEYRNPPVGAYYTSGALVGMIARELMDERERALEDACHAVHTHLYSDESVEKDARELAVAAISALKGTP